MTIFTCQDTFEAMMTCIYQAWESGLGHQNIRLQTLPIGNYRLFADYREVAPDSLKAAKVSRAICKKISLRAYEIVYYCAMSDREDKLDLIYRFLLLGFAYGSKILSMEPNPHIRSCLSLHKRVAGEAHKFIEFTRFFQLGQEAFFAQISPKSRILSLIAPHFHNRMPSLHWAIYDRSHRQLLLQPKDEDYYFQRLSLKEEENIKTLSSPKDDFEMLWKEFFDTVAIKERQNPKVQQRFLPLWIRKNMTEFLP